MKELITLASVYYPQLIPIIITAILIGYIIGQFATFVDLQTKILNREELKGKVEQEKFNKKQKNYQKAFDECGFIPGRHGLYGETYNILNDLRNLRNAIKDFTENNGFDAEKTLDVYFWTDISKPKEYRFIFKTRFKKWKDNFNIDKKIVKNIEKLENLILKQEIKIRETEEKRENSVIHPILKIEYIDFITVKDIKKIITIIDELESELKNIKTIYHLDNHGTIPV